MTKKRLLLLGGVLLILFLAMYSWNRRTQVLDDLAANVGLEISGAILTPLRALEDMVGDFWTRYVSLVDVREENLRLQKKAAELEALLIAQGEDLAELKRLRALLQLPADARWRPLGAKVLAGRIGPNAVLDSLLISRGYMNGAKPGVPIVTNLGLVGRVLRSSPNASTALLITDPGSRIAVYGQESRAEGILKGQGLDLPLEIEFVQRDAGIRDGEIIVTSGLDGKFPKGLPVARVTSVAPSDYTQFMAVKAKPLVDLRHMEEVLLLEKTGVELPPEEQDIAPGEFVGPPLPPYMAKARQASAAKVSRQTDPAVDQAVSAGQARQPAVTQQPAQSLSPANHQPQAPAAQPQPENAGTTNTGNATVDGQTAQGDTNGRQKAPHYIIITP